MSGRLAGLSPVKREAYRRLRSRAAGPLVTLRPGDRGPVVLVHPVGGSLLCYVPLLAALPAGPPVLGFAADERSVVPTGIPALAAEYLAALGGRPVALYAGWSFGGAVAYEMGRAVGAPVVLIDTDPHGREPGVPITEATIRWYFVHDLARLVGIAESDVRRVRSAAAHATVEELLRDLGVEIDLSGDELAARYRLFAANTRALAEYRPGRYDGPVTWIGSPRSGGTGWEAYAPDIRVHEVAGTDHYTLLHAAHAGVVASHLHAALD